jgi:hypothetical protein
MIAHHCGRVVSRFVVNYDNLERTVGCILGRQRLQERWQAARAIVGRDRDSDLGLH